MGSVSLLSVLAGALSAFAVFEVLVAIAAAIGLAANGSTNFSAMSDARFKAAVGVTLAVALFLAFVFGGYVSGRMSRRRGATHGLMAGLFGVILAAGVVAAARAIGADNGLARVATHIQVANTWSQWRTFGLIGTVAAAAAMILGSLCGGVPGERWHGKLLARAVDPAYGPEAEERAEAQRRLKEAEVARLAAANHVGRLTATNRAATADVADGTRAQPVAAQRAPTAPGTPGAPTGPTTAVLNRHTQPGPVVAANEPVAADPVVDDAGHRRLRHLSGAARRKR